ncbi:MAG: response regulator transcription factor [Anditalea sp.]
MKILIVEDEPDMLNSMVHSLREEQFIIETAENYTNALEKIGVYNYDCILLDISLPGGNGLDLLNELKRQSKTEGVIIVSAKDSLDDKVKGLDMGADDYLAKPFHMAELHARVNAVFRRRKLDGNQIITIGNVAMDPRARTAAVNGEDLNLNRKEYDILLYLVTNKNRLVQKTALVEHVWGDYIDEADSFEFIYSQIKNLRKKLRDKKAEIEIQSIYGIGYRILVQ